MRRAVLTAPLCLAAAALLAAGWARGKDKDETLLTAAPLSGANEVPPRTTAAHGTAAFTPEDATVEYRVELHAISGVTAARIHSGAPGTSGPVRVVLFTGPVTGEVNGKLVEGTFSEAHLRGITLSELLNEMRNGMAYVNVNTSAFPAGEVRAQVRLAN
jgi:hypothetical protein